MIAATTTRNGFRVHTERDIRPYPPGMTVSDAAMDEIDVRPHAFHGDWNHRIMPRAALSLALSLAAGP